MGYQNNPDLLGIIFYGSFINGNFHDKSDIDLHIIMTNESNVNFRGTQIVNGFKIEYFEKTIGELYETVDTQYETQNDAPVTMFLDGLVVLNKSNEIDVFRQYIANKFKNGLPKMDHDDIIDNLVLIESRLVAMKDFYEAKNFDAFYLLFYNTLERIRKVYTRMMQKSYIPDHKIYILYTSKEYLTNYHKTIPEEEFVRMYLETLDIGLSIEERLDKILELYEYSFRNIRHNSNDYRIRVKKIDVNNHT